MTNRASRRQFLRTASGLAGALGSGVPLGNSSLAAGLASLGAMAAQSSAAADLSGGYKALVCLYMHGGSDSHNWVVPTDPTGYAEYSAARRELAWSLSKLQPLTVSGQASGRTFGMPEELAPLRRWYHAGQAAIIANVGPLLRPITKAEYLAGTGRPAKLFSHNDQASTWQSLSPEGARSGWGGRMGDVLMSANAYPVFTAVSATGNAVFLTGGNVTQYQVGMDGPVQISGLSAPSVFSATAAPAALRRTLADPGSTALQAEYTKVMQRSATSNSFLESALARIVVPAIPTTSIPQGLGSPVQLSQDGLARQLKMVAQLIGAGQAMGMRRQVFMVSMGGFDSHADQMRDQPGLMARVAQSIDYFMNALTNLGMLNNVTLFTASDFGRTLLSNGSGCDHGWGSHHVVAGGAVLGGNIHGRFPATRLGSSDDIGSGRLLPAHSVVQFAAPLGRWLGLSASELAMVLPGLSEFDAQALRFI